MADRAQLEPRIGWRGGALLALALLLNAEAPLQAQEAASDAPRPDRPSETISGFENVPWGATESDIVALYGEPIERRRLDSGLNMIAYRDDLAGRASILLFGLLDEDGLVKAQEVVDLPEDESCIEMIRRIHRQINLRYPLIRPAEQAKNNSRDAVCVAAPQGLAYWHRQWRDEATGSVVTVSLESGSEQVDLTYESQRFREWVDPDGAARVQVLEDEGAPPEVLAPARP